MQEFFSIKELAVHFACHPSTIRRAIKKGYIVALRLSESKRSPYRISIRSINEIHSSIIRELASKYKNPHYGDNATKEDIWKKEDDSVNLLP